MLTFLRRLTSKRTIRPLTVTQRFVLLGGFATFVLASLVSILVNQYLVRNEMTTIATSTRAVVDHFVIPTLNPEQFTLSAQSDAYWQTTFTTLKTIEPFEKFKVLSPDYIIISATDTTRVGEYNPSTYASRALNGDVVYSSMFSGDVLHRQNDQAGTLMEVYVPLRLPATSGVVGVLELYVDITATSQKLIGLQVGVVVVAFLIFGLFFLALFAVLTASKQQQLAYRDPLTGLSNRHLFNKRVSEVLAFSKPNELSALLFMDLSRFKFVNDSLGHSAGDEILRQVAQRLSQCIRDDDVISRLGGDEFAILLSGIHSEEQAALIARRIQDMFKVPFCSQEQSLHIGIHIGISLYQRAKNTPTISVETWLTQADSAMYISKENNNSFQFYNPSMRAYTLERLRLEEDLRSALNDDALTLHFQPVSNTEHQIIGAETLLRWHHPEHGLIPPGDFIHLAEESGLIKQLDYWVIHNALLQAADWAQQGIHLDIAVNVSPYTFQDAAFPAWLESLLNNINIPSSQLTLEITENVLADAKSSKASLETIVNLGVKVALDDFGKGYSSLAYLESLPIDIIKIDKQFIDGIKQRTTSEAIIKTIIALTQNLGIQCLAEGIETPEQLEWLLGEGCDLFQGYYLGKPVSVDVFQSHCLIPNVQQTASLLLHD